MLPHRLELVLHVLRTAFSRGLLRAVMGWPVIRLTTRKVRVFLHARLIGSHERSNLASVSCAVACDVRLTSNGERY